LERNDGGRVFADVSWIFERELSRFVVVYLVTCVLTLPLGRNLSVHFFFILGFEIVRVDLVELVTWEIAVCEASGRC